MDEAYFQDYCGYGSYDSQYLFHSGIQHCMEVIERYSLEVRSVMVLGAATGQVLGHFEAELDVVPQGCELSPWAHARIPERYRGRIQLADMRSYVPAMRARGQRFDLCFTNALIYLQEDDIAPLLADVAATCRYLHLASSTSEYFEPGDRYITVLKPRAWWRQRLLEAGMRPTRSRYLWRQAG